MKTISAPRTTRVARFVGAALLVVSLTALAACKSAPSYEVTAAAVPTSDVAAPANYAPGVAAAPSSEPTLSPDPDVFIPADDEATPPPEATVAPVPASELRWACAGDGWGESEAPVSCLPLPPCYFAASCQLEDQDWYQPSKIPASLLRAACADIAAAHHKTVNRCLADIRGWDQKQGWGVDDYIYADPDAPLYPAGN